MRDALSLSQLRQIGWSQWDPIGLGGGEGPPPEALDEYDSYLLEAVAMLRNGAADTEVVAYLVAIECEHMGLGERSDVQKRADRTVAELQSLVARNRGT